MGAYFGLDGFRRDGGAAVGGQGGGEEAAQFREFAVVAQVFAVDGAGDGGGVQPGVGGDVFHFHGAKVLFPPQEEIALPLRDGLCDSQDGLLALFDGADEVAPLPETVGEILPDFFFVGLFRHHLAVGGR